MMSSFSDRDVPPARGLLPAGQRDGVLRVRHRDGVPAAVLLPQDARRQQQGRGGGRPLPVPLRVPVLPQDCQMKGERKGMMLNDAGGTLTQVQTEVGMNSRWDFMIIVEIKVLSM